jgi:hypothetical protein
MKNVLKIFGIIVMAAVIMFPMVSCGDDSVVSVIGGVLELTKLEKYNGKYVAAFGTNNDGSLELIAAASVNANDQTITGIKISGGKAILSVWVVGGTEDNPTFTGYGGSDTMTFAVSISDNPIVNNDSDDSEGGWAIVTFQKGVGVGVFSDIDIDNPGGGQNNGTSVNISVPSALVGTWTGDTLNGTLVFTASSISTPDAATTKAYAVITGIKQQSNLGMTVTINNDGTISTVVNGIVSVNLYTWTITDTTLTITDNKNTFTFTGTKQ